MAAHRLSQTTQNHWEECLPCTTSCLHLQSKEHRQVRRGSLASLPPLSLCWAVWEHWQGAASEVGRSQKTEVHGTTCTCPLPQPGTPASPGESMRSEKGKTVPTASEDTKLSWIRNSKTRDRRGQKPDLEMADPILEENERTDDFRNEG